MIEAKECGRTPTAGRPDRFTARSGHQNHAPALKRMLGGSATRFLAAAVSCAFLVGVAIAWIDRPVATWVHEHLGDARFDWFNAPHDGHPLPIGPFSLMAAPAEALRPLALVVLMIMALAALGGWRPGPKGRIALVLNLAIFAAVEINNAAKLAFGRTWPESWQGNNPSWIRDGVFGFFPFHRGSGWTSFPSGHTTIITATATFLWIVWPGLRRLWAAMVVVVMTGLIGANYHFVSDIIGGAYLGVAVGVGAIVLLGPRQTPVCSDRTSDSGQ